MKIKRFLCFSSDRYYPSGGWDDFEASYDTLEEAQAHRFSSGDEHIIDLQTAERWEPHRKGWKLVEVAA